MPDATTEKNKPTDRSKAKRATMVTRSGGVTVVQPKTRKPAAKPETEKEDT